MHETQIILKYSKCDTRGSFIILNYGKCDTLLLGELCKGVIRQRQTNLYVVDSKKRRAMGA